MAQEEQITRLNERVKVRIAPSTIHGVGVFALRDIAKGQKLYADHLPEVYSVKYSDFGKLFPEVRALLLERWPLVVNGSRFAYPDTMILGYMNHSDTPNYDSVADVLLTDVKKGEEITEDYRKIKGYAQIFTWLAPRVV